MTIIPRITQPGSGLALQADGYYAVWHVQKPEDAPLRRRMKKLFTTDLAKARRLRDELFAAMLRKRGCRVALKGGRPRKEKPEGLGLPRGMSSAEMKEALNQLDRAQAKRKEKS